jgi:hypothetical protein
VEARLGGGTSELVDVTGDGSPGRVSYDTDGNVTKAIWYGDSRALSEDEDITVTWIDEHTPRNAPHIINGKDVYNLLGWISTGADAVQIGGLGVCAVTVVECPAEVVILPSQRPLDW